MCLFGGAERRRLVLYRHILRSFVIFKSCIVKNRNKNLKRIVKFANFFAYFIVKNAKFLLTERFFYAILRKRIEVNYVKKKDLSNLTSLPIVYRIGRKKAIHAPLSFKNAQPRFENVKKCFSSVTQPMFFKKFVLKYLTKS